MNAFDPLADSLDSRISQVPFRGAPQTVAGIREAALKAERDFSVRRLAETICENLKAKDYLSESLAIANFVEGNTRYFRDPKNVQLVKSPVISANQILNGRIPQINCVSMTALNAALLLSAGCKIRLVTVAFKNMFHNNERQYSHVFLEAFEPRSGAWIVIDPVAGPGTPGMLQRGVAFRFWPIG